MQYDMVVNVGPRYAELLGYQEAVGAMGIISRAMSALIEVQVLSGPAIGKTFDIHKDDVLIEQIDDSGMVYLIADYDAQRCYFTRDKDMYNFIGKTFSWGKSFRDYQRVDLDRMMDHYEKFTFHDADHDGDKVTKVFRDTLAAQKAVQEK
jgi:hypothetical protein